MTTLNFYLKITTGVYRSVVNDNSRYCAVQNVGSLPKAVFDSLHQNHNGEASANFILWHHGMKTYDMVYKLSNVMKQIEKFEKSEIANN
jgi:hypothetical protein